MQIAPAQPEDALAVAQIHVSAWQAAYKDILPPEYLAALSVPKRQTLWDVNIATGTSHLLVAKSNGVVCGWINFAASRDSDAQVSDAEVWALYVAPAFWSTGTGRKLWLEAKAMLIAHGFAACSLWVFPQNACAIRFYQAAGFVADDCAAKSFELGGRQLSEVRYRISQLA